ncbi:hypothetical protein Lser_V15G01010 [Lactuca serriola]
MADSSSTVNDSSVPNNSSPFFIASSDTPNSILVSTVFNGVGFNSWKRSMILSLSAKNKLGFVDGSIAKPDFNSSSFSLWFRANSMVISWILNSLSKTITDSVLFFESTSEIWNELIQRYEQSSGAQLYQIQQQLYSLSQGSDDFSTYFTKITKIWDELRILQDLPSCSCGTAARIQKFLDDQRLIQLLMDLNDTYKVVRGQLLMMKPLPSVSTAYSILLQEEQQRGITNSPSIHSDAIAMQASYDNSSKKTLTCNHCKKSGHTKAQCYRLNGFPPNFKFTKGKRDDIKSTAQNVTTQSTSPIIVDQYNQLLQLLTIHNFSPSSSSTQANTSITEGAMNNEGPFIEE